MRLSIYINDEKDAETLVREADRLGVGVGTMINALARKYAREASSTFEGMTREQLTDIIGDSRGMNRLTDELVLEVLERIKKGEFKNVTQACQELEINKSSFTSRVSRMGKKTPDYAKTRKLDRETLLKVEKMRKTMKWGEIATELGVSLSGLRSSLKREGLL